MIFDFRFTRFAVAFVALIGIPAAVFADDPPKAKTLPEAKKSTAFDPVEITIHPKTAPVPALKYRLFPAEPDRTPGDAAPIYIRLGVGMQGTETIHKRVGELASLPVKDLPIDEARKLVEQLRFRLEQLSFGARRKTCDWNYTLSEQREDAITILLPDVQEMRNWTRVLQVKIGLEIAEKKYDDAIRDIETGIAFSRHVGEGPFLINMLVGTAQANVMLAKIEELIAEPDAPNLYWALTALPQPLVGVRMALENEQRLGEWMIPEITNLDLPRTDGEWSAVLGRLHARLMKLRKDLVSQEQKATGQLGEDRTLAEFRNENLATQNRRRVGR